MAKVLIIGKYYYPFMGGIEDNTQSIAEYLATHHDVTVLANNHSPGNVVDDLNGVKVIRRNVDVLMKGQPISFNFLKGVRLSDYDVIQFHSPNPFVSAMVCLHNLVGGSAPIVVTHHMDIHGRRLLRALAWPFMHHLLGKAAAIIVTSANNARLSKDLPRDRDFKVVPLGIREADYVVDDTLREEAIAWRRSLCGDTSSVIGFVGRHARYKGLDVLMRALVDLPGVHALLAGDGPYRQSTEDLARELGLEDRVHFLGLVDSRTKLKLLSAIDCFAFPSTETTEAFGVSQMEAMLCGAPVVASNLPTGVTDVAIDGQTALLAEPGDVESLRDRISTMLSDRALAARLAQAGREHIRTNMEAEVVAKRTTEIIEGAMRAPRVAQAA